MLTAFQPSTFQNNAFQIDVASGGGGGSAGGSSGRRKHIPGFISIYEILAHRELSKRDKQSIIAAIDPFIDAETIEEQQRRDSALYILEDLPPANRVDFSSLYENPLARLRLSQLLMGIDPLLMQSWEDEELFMLILAVI